MRYRLSKEARMDLARIYWHGVEEFAQLQAERYYDALVHRFDEISEAPYKFPAVDHVRDGYRRSVCGVDKIYFRLNGEIIEIMRVLGRQDAAELL